MQQPKEFRVSPNLEFFNLRLQRWEDMNGDPIQKATEPDPSEPNVSESKPPFLINKSQLDNLKSINGLTLEQIEARARPGAFSQSGFIGKDESFIEVLKKDWETVESLKVTHEQLATHLKNIINCAQRYKSPYHNHANPEAFEYSSEDLKDFLTEDGPQMVEVFLNYTRGQQDDLFEPIDPTQREVDTPQGWNEEIVVKNPSNGIELRLNTGILSYIREFGFYEGGGDENPYRVDPRKVMSLLTGKTY